MIQILKTNRPLTLANKALVAMALVVTATAGVLSAAPAQAQGTWPDKPLKLVVPYPAGGNADNTARLLATQLGQRLGQQVVVDNRPGGSGTIGAAAVASPEMKKRFAELGVQGVGSSAQEFSSFLKAETTKWAEVIRTSGIRMD